MDTSKFGSAFAAARKAGDKTFEFNGKKFTTETKDDQNNAVTAKFNKLRDAPKGADTAKMRADAEYSARKAPGSGAVPSRETAANPAGQAKGTQFVKMSNALRDLPSGASEATRKSMGLAVERAKDEYEATAKYAKGGSVRGDGCATKGKTKGRMV